MEHNREVIQVDEFLGGVAGMYDLLMYLIFFVFGQYISFLSKVKWMKSRYLFEDCSHEASHNILFHKNEDLGE